MLLGLWLAGALGGDDRGARRAAVTAYLERVNDLQLELGVPVYQASTAYERIQRGTRSLAESAPELRRSAETMATLNRRVSAIVPPKDARALHGKLVDLLGLEAQFAADVALLGRYLPSLSAVERDLARAGTALSTGLRRARVPKEQAAAFSSFSLTVKTLIRRLEALKPPPLLEAARRAEVRRAQALGGIARRIGDALAGRGSEDPQVLLGEFAAAAQGGASRVERKAIIAFNRRLKTMAELEIAVQEERTRLDRSLA